MPLQLGLGIQMHKHGFCVSYSEVLKYERYASVHQGTKIPGVSESSSAEPTHFMHHVADNADHNSRTLDGRHTFHGMGIICCYTCSFLVLNHTTFRRCVNRRSDQTYRDRTKNFTIN